MAKERRRTSGGEQARVAIDSAFMNIYKWADQVFMVNMYESVFGPNADAFPESFPDTRELNIQIAKWRRMIDERGESILLVVPRGTTKRLGLKGLTKKQLREEGRRTSALMQQGKKVRSMVLELFRQFFAEQRGKRGEKFTRKDFATFRLEMETKFAESRKHFFERAQVDEWEMNKLRELAPSLRRLK